MLNRLPPLLQALLAIVAGTAALVGCTPQPDRETPVGRTTVVTVDDNRPAWGIDGGRPIVITIWYPAASDSRETQWQIGIFNAGWTSIGAELADSAQRLPLVVLSHGTGGAALQLSWLAESLATNGYVVAAVNHHGNTAAEPVYQAQGFFLWWERAQDVSIAIDTVLDLGQFGHRIDPTRIGVGGFSLGGFTSLLTAGALVDRPQWVAFCRQHPNDAACALPPEAPFTQQDIEQLVAADEAVIASLQTAGRSRRDTRVRAAYAIAPVLAPALTIGSLNAIDIPVRIVVGRHDNQAQPATNARPLHAAMPSSTLLELPGVGHYTFLANCTLRGRWLVADLCKDLGDVDRHEIHAQVAADALVFFRQHLRAEAQP
ncbi:MAG: alpha/beta hydrolase [Pseudomonadota bacterium]